MTTEPSPEYARAYLRAARETLVEADVLVERGLLKGALNRAYYATFYAALAALLSAGATPPKRHTSVINLFYRLFVLPGRVPRDSHRHLVRGFQLRQQSDYEIHARFAADDLARTLAHAQDFVVRVEAALEAGGSSPR